MNKKLIRVVIPVLIVIEFSFIFLTFMSYQNKDINSIKETSKVDKERFAMYVENLEGGYDQVEKISDISARHVLDQEKTMCVDNKGEKVENVLTYADGKVTVTSNKTLFCYLYFDMKIDVQIDVTTDGENGKVPTTLGYKKTITCEDGTSPSWNYKYNRLEFTGIGSGETKCNLTYTKDTNTYETLINVVKKDDEVQYTSYDEPDYTTGVSLTENEYKNIEMFSSSGMSSTSGTSLDNIYTYNTSWESLPENMDSGKYYHIKVSPTDPGYYKICYTMSTGHTSNTLSVYVDATQKKLGQYGNSISSNTTSESSGCAELGYVSEDSYIKVVQYAYSSSSANIPNIKFDIQKVDYVDNSTGYRYFGTNPDNYIWFNNEMWRIIGVIPTKVSEDGTTKNLVKIIRNNYIGNLAYDANSDYTSNWGENTLYKLLNEYYYGKKDGSNSDYCYNTFNYSKQKTNCNYKNIGIDVNDYYGKMIESVYWNTGYSSVSRRPSEAFYLDEVQEKNVKGKIGLMSMSDFGYATLKKYHRLSYNVQLNSSENKLAMTTNNWLYSTLGEWTLTKTATLNSVHSINEDYVMAKVANIGYSVRPVVYLNSSIDIISGTGTEADPYLIAMK